MNVEIDKLIWCDPDVRADRCEFSRRYGADEDIYRLVELAQPVKNDSVLDLVTGLGFSAFALSPFVGSIDAVDPDEEILAEARSTAKESALENINFLVGDPLSIPAKDSIYSLVVARNAMHHTSEASKCLKEIHRVLKPDGRIIIIDSLKPLQPDLAGYIESLQKQRDRSHVRSYDLQEWESIIDRAGFDINLMEIFPREYKFETWANVSDNDPDTVKMLSMMLHGASPRAKRHFKIVEKSGKPVSFVTWMVLIRACLRGEPETR